jgi:hypothetical protein
MSEPTTTPPQDSPPEDRRAQVAERTKHLRSLGVAGAVATLGVFAGLAAVTHTGSGSAQPAATSVDSATDPSQATRPDDQLPQFDRFGQFGQGDFFDSPGSGSGGISPGASGSPPSAMSGGS